MANSKRSGKEVMPSSKPSYTPDRGPKTDPNPGERSAQDVISGVPTNSLGAVPARGNRAGGGQQIDVGAQVGIMRNLEFTAGGRAQRLITGTFSYNRPTFDPKSERIHVSTATDSGEPSVGPKANADHQPMPERVQGAGATTDASTGDTSPDRRRDKRTT